MFAFLIVFRPAFPAGLFHFVLASFVTASGFFVRFFGWQIHNKPKILKSM